MSRLFPSATFPSEWAG